MAEVVNHERDTKNLFLSPKLSPKNTVAEIRNDFVRISQKRFTDGAITDMQQIIDAIVDASFSALSIIIIGVGNADFSAMDDLDCDDGLLRSSSGRTAQRDIVQFVPMNKFKNDPIRLAEEVLAEVPEQVQQWARFNNIKPNFDFQPVNHDPTAPPPYGF